MAFAAVGRRRSQAALAKTTLAAHAAPAIAAGSGLKLGAVALAGLFAGGVAFFTPMQGPPHIEQTPIAQSISGDHPIIRHRPHRPGGVPVPEPASLALLALGAATAIACARRAMAVPG